MAARRSPTPPNASNNRSINASPGKRMSSRFSLLAHAVQRPSSAAPGRPSHARVTGLGLAPVAHHASLLKGRDCLGIGNSSVWPALTNATQPSYRVSGVAEVPLQKQCSRPEPERRRSHEVLSDCRTDCTETTNRKGAHIRCFPSGIASVTSPCDHSRVEHRFIDDYGSLALAPHARYRFRCFLA